MMERRVAYRITAFPIGLSAIHSPMDCRSGLPAASRRSAARLQTATAGERRWLSFKNISGSPVEHAHCSTGVNLNVIRVLSSLSYF